MYKLINIEFKINGLQSRIIKYIWHNYYKNRLIMKNKCFEF